MPIKKAVELLAKFYETDETIFTLKRFSGPELVKWAQSVRAGGHQLDSNQYNMLIGR